jgi:hypothetical protein
MLTLPIKKEWFDMIVAGEKKEEYREIKPYYLSRFQNHFYPDGNNDLITVRFRNGYGEDKPTIECQCKLSRGKGKEEWGAERNKEYFVLTILDFKNLN